MIIEIEDYVQEFLAWGTRLQESNTSSTKELIEAFADQFRSLEVVDSQMEHHGIWDAMRLSGGSSSPLLHSYPFDFRLSNRHWRGNWNGGLTKYFFSTVPDAPPSWHILGYDTQLWMSMTLERCVAIAYPVPESDGESQSFPTLLSLNLYFAPTDQKIQTIWQHIEEYDDLSKQLQRFFQEPIIAPLLAQVPTQLQTYVSEHLL
nr:hypothetical protein [Armatimonas sp.]